MFRVVSRGNSTHSERGRCRWRLHFERKAQSLFEIKFPMAQPTTRRRCNCRSDATDGRCIAVGGLAIELRSDRCTLSYIRIWSCTLRLPRSPAVWLSLSLSPLYPSCSLLSPLLLLSLSLPQGINNAATSDRVLTRDVLKVVSAMGGLIINSRFDRPHFYGSNQTGYNCEICRRLWRA